MSAKSKPSTTVIDELFNGDKELYLQFRAMTLPRLKVDVQTADDALARSDLEAFAGVMHNLKSVLRLIGQTAESDAAQYLDALARQADLDGCVAPWRTLRMALRDLSAEVEAS